MPYRPTKKLIALFGFIFVCALLFFGITNQVAKDVAEAKAEKTKRTFTETVSDVVAEIADAVVPEPLVNLIPSKKSENTSTYLEVTDSCGVHFGGECLRVRSGPGTNFPVVASLRNGMVLKVSETITTGTSTWHKVIFDEWLRYPERHNGDWYVAAEYVTLLEDPGTKTLDTHPLTGTSSKSILVDRSDQMLYAYDGDEIFMVATTSTGLDSTPTPRGVFTVFKKTPSRYMQGPLPNINSDDYYDLPGVPWNLYFTEGGAVIHGAYWHDSFGTKYSHGCVNLEPSIARTLYEWADLGMKVTVRD
ncbi:L,D-transpeptidase family protein [Patescibacteria group bacterium]|nr:L,D-transpeptidase family protein [Patescibacteria group bacterium]